MNPDYPKALNGGNHVFIPRNHKVEEALAAATTHGDLSWSKHPATSSWALA